MKKLNDLRTHLLNAVVELRRDPDRLLLFAEQGVLKCTFAAGLSYEYAYQANLILTDYAGDIDSIAIPLFDWLRINQGELLANLDRVKEGIRFEADLLDNHKVDLAITIPLTERVIVKRDKNNVMTIDHPPEPYISKTEPGQEVTLIDQSSGEPLAVWQSADIPDSYALAMPHLVPPNRG
ncbi:MULTISPECIES: phage tail protein [unclassified Acinetobacter]|uniref:phage tail protein n=1 Tax=unclassified Acinetobacter TaxID=196816 RepID=UPI00190A563D|nr:MULTISPECIES: phage tail protein [unclassified Acinetobacter]MBK0062622.1 phage tail protein [Acinetobacter sp. S55]MBK0065801.1 phage tail protein [Acinetobacter sp. S54]